MEIIIPKSFIDTVKQLNEDANEVELISVTDFYPLKTIKESIIIDSEYYDLIKLRIDYFEKLANIFKNLK